MVLRKHMFQYDLEYFYDIHLYIDLMVILEMLKVVSNII
jgi:hypothetical protein